MNEQKYWLKENTAEDYLTLHKELWMWIAENPRFRQNDWPRWESNGGDISDVGTGCFACEWAENQEQRSCDNCLVDWGQDRYCFRGRSLYIKWVRAELGSKERAELARQIANLPLAMKWKKGAGVGRPAVATRLDIKH